MNFMFLLVLRYLYAFNADLFNFSKLLKSIIRFFDSNSFGITSLSSANGNAVFIKLIFWINSL